MRNIRSTTAAVAVVGALALAGSLAIPGTAAAGDGACDRGNFCAWQHTNYDGHRESWSGDDRFWGNNNNINDQDSSWRNAGISGPGVRDHVQVYDGYFLGGGRTLCLRPGERVAGNGGANDRGSSHTWTFGC